MITIKPWITIGNRKEWMIINCGVCIYALSIEYNDTNGGYIARAGEHYITWIPENKIEKWEE